MVTYMNEQKIPTQEDVKVFLAGTVDVEFSIQDKEERHRWIEQTLRRFKCRALGRFERGGALRYVERVSGYSRQTVTQLVAQYRDTRRLQRRQRTAAGFARYYTDADARLLAELDALPRHPLWGGGQKAVRAHVRDPRHCALRSALAHLGLAPVQPAQGQWLPPPTPPARQDRPEPLGHRLKAQTCPPKAG